MTARIIITNEQKPISAPIIYTFINGAGDVQKKIIGKHENLLDKYTGNQRGYRLFERRI